jgi:hypothetical protein
MIGWFNLNRNYLRMTRFLGEAGASCADLSRLHDVIGGEAPVG